MFKKIILTLSTLTLMLILAALVIPFLIPADEYQKRLLLLAEEKIGRKITVGGEVEFTLLPEVAVQIKNITVANAQGFTAPYFARLEQLNLLLDPWPLLDRQVIVKELVISRPTIYLEKNASGKTNWEFAPEKSSSAKASAPVEMEEEGPTLHYDVGNVRITDGTVDYQAPGRTLQASEVTLKFTPEELAGSAGLFWQNVPVHLMLNADTPSLLWEGRDLPVKLVLQSKYLRAALEGVLKGIDLSASRFDWEYDGLLQVESGSVAKVQKKFFGKAGGLDQSLTLEAVQTVLTPKKLTMNTLQLQMGDTEAKGNVTVDFSGKKPSIQANLEIPKLVMDEYVSIHGGDDDEALSVMPSTEPSEEGWSREPIDLSALNEANAELDLKISQYAMQQMVLDNLEAKLKLRNGKLEIAVPQAGLAGGSVTVKAGVDTMQSTSLWHKEVTLKNVPFEELTGSFLKKNRLKGITNGEISFKGKGNSVHDWVSSLSGGGNLAVTEGEIKGYSLAKLFRHLRSTTEDPKASSKESTPFNKLDVTFTADSGVINLKQGTLDSPHLQATTSGDVSMKDKSVNLRLKPIIVPRLPQEEGEQAAGLLVPLKIKGPFHDIAIRPDLTAAVNEALTNPQSAKDAATVIREEGRAIRKDFKETKESVKENWKQLKESKDPAALNNLLGTIGEATGLKLPNVAKPQPQPPAADSEPAVVPIPPAPAEPAAPDDQ